MQCAQSYEMVGSHVKYTIAFSNFVIEPLTEAR